MKLRYGLIGILWSQWLAIVTIGHPAQQVSPVPLGWVVQKIASQIDTARFDSAQYYLNQSIRLIDRQPNAELAFYLSAYQSEVFYHNALFEQSIQYALRGLHQAEALRDSTMMANQHNLLGLCYTDLGQLTKAIHHLQRSLNLLPAHPRSRYTLSSHYHILSNIGQCYHKTGQYDVAIAYNRRSYQEAQRYQFPSLRGMSIAAWALGNDYSALRQIGKADHWYRESIRYAQRANDYDAAILSYPALFSLHYAKQPLLARQYLIEGVRHMEAHQDHMSTYMKRFFAERQTEIYFRLKQYQRAVESHRLLEQINQEITEKEKQQRLYMVQAYYDNERQQLQTRANEQVRQGELQRNRQLTIALGGLACLLLVALVAVYYGYRQKQRVKDLLQQKRITELEQKQEISVLKAMMTGEERERVRIAHELHDGLSGLLAAARYQVEGYFRQPKNGPSDVAVAPVSLLDEASHEVRRISHNLMPYALQRYGLTGALRDYIANLRSSALPELYVELTGPEPALPATAKLWLYRCAQELIGNALRHANPSHIWLRCQALPGQFCLSVSDDGCGFELAHAFDQDGSGLRNVQTRLSHLGGQLTVQSTPSTLTIISLSIPLTVTQTES